MDEKEKKWSTVLKILPEKGGRPPVIIREAGDGFIQVEYGLEQRVYLPDAFRVAVMGQMMRDKKIKGFWDAIPAARSNMFTFDPTVISPAKMLGEIIECEDSLTDLSDLVMPSRKIRLPIAFDDSATKKCIEEYERKIRAGSPCNVTGSNLDYIALVNGITVDQVKEFVTTCVYYNVCNGFGTGGMFQPMDPRMAIVVPKYNPSRIWTPADTVSFGGSYLYAYPCPFGGGYQMLGRTIPTLQYSMLHPAFQEEPFLFRTADQLQYFEVTEEEIVDIYNKVQTNTGGYEYDISETKFVVKDYIDWIHTDSMVKETAEFKARQQAAVEAAPSLI